MQTYIYLLIEFLDGLVFGVAAAATPLIRDDLTLNYAQIGLLFSLLGDFLLIPLVERVRGLDYLCWRVLVLLVLFPAFLIISVPWLKLVIVGLMGFFNAGWYAILKANMFSAIPRAERHCPGSG